MVQIPLNLCCPLGTAYKPDPYPESVSRTCQQHPEEELVFTVPGITLQLQGGEEKFQCGPGFDQEDLNWPGHDAEVLQSGSLQVTTPDLNVSFPPGQYCLYFYTSEEEIRTLFSVCFESIPEPPSCSAAAIAYPVLIFISTIFIFLTMILHVCNKDNRTKIFGRFTTGFLINVFFAFLFSGIDHSLKIIHNQSNILEKSGCKALGYLIHHTWISFFFWISAIALDMTYTFHQILHHLRHDPHRHRKTKITILSILYAQGVPFLITFFTILVDNLQPEGFILPNVGYYSCFLGHEGFVPFLKTPVFLYFYLIIILIISINIVCFLMTGFFLMRHWSQMRSMNSNQSIPVDEAKVLAKLSVIMGLPWLVEIVSGAVGPVCDTEIVSSSVQWTLDILTLLQGPLIFLVLTKPWFLIKHCQSWCHGSNQVEPRPEYGVEDWPMESMARCHGIGGTKDGSDTKDTYSSDGTGNRDTHGISTGTTDSYNISSGTINTHSDDNDKRFTDNICGDETKTF